MQAWFRLADLPFRWMPSFTPSNTFPSLGKGARLIASLSGRRLAGKIIAMDIWVRVLTLSFS